MDALQRYSQAIEQATLAMQDANIAMSCLFDGHLTLEERHVADVAWIEAADAPSIWSRHDEA